MELEGSKKWVINLYVEQLEKFAKVGLGKLTEFNVKVTKKLIEVTEKRLAELTTVYDGRLTSQALKLRRLKLAHLNGKGQLNGTTNGTRATTTQISKDIRTDGHEGSKS